MTGRRLALALVVFALACVILVAAAAATPSSSSPKTQATTAAYPGNASEGRTLLRSQGCGSCHMMMAAGEMNGSGVGPDLDSVTKTYAQIVKQITDGGGGMAPYKGVLSTAQIEDIAVFVWDTSHPSKTK